ncbi:CHAD domain-containing protein [Alcanivorax sp. 1008]|uniref:CHAD domain-containing protein n=1 Tax=Alcanivorax sp. 1008 TaxID=2816853 RepID=UPI001D2C8688|nr:CHAD domain-containing protein [Alcanivorax sp. 1008]MCC1497100.1 CHAD domain-containing protein [Alcanivorax sp. 1008]
MSKSAIEPLVQHALQVHDDVSEMLADDEILGDDVIHGIRVASKELRALWQVIKPLLDDNRAKQSINELRDAAATLSEARDRYVIIQTLERLCQKAPSKDARKALTATLDKLCSQKQEADRGTATAAQLHECWQQDRQRWQSLDISVDSNILLAEGYGRLYRKAHRLTRTALRSDDIQHWHALRKWTKYLSLTLPVYAQSAKLERLTDDITRLGKKLGRLHDLDRLLLAVNELDWTDDDPERGAYVSHLVRREIGNVVSQCSKLAKALFNDEPRQFVVMVKRLRR